MMSRVWILSVAARSSVVCLTVLQCYETESTFDSNAVRVYILFFSSRRRHTIWNCDWSSDVCSSDLPGACLTMKMSICRSARTVRDVFDGTGAAQIGRASCRERVEISVVAVSLQ